MSVLSDPDFMSKVRAAGEKGDDALCDFLEATARSVQRENRARARVQHNKDALEKLNRMRKARGLSPVSSLS